MRGSRLGVRHVEDRLLVSGDAAWAWFSLPTRSYDLLSAGERTALLDTTVTALAGLAAGDCHLVVVPDPYDASRWADTLDAATTAPAPGWHGYLTAVTAHLAQASFWSRRVYLGVALGRRAPGERRLRPSATGAVADAELARWRIKAEAVGRVLSGSALRGRAAGAAELTELVRRSFWRGIGPPPPPLETGAGTDLAELARSRLRNGYRSLALSQPEGEAHVAFLAAARFPDVMVHPGAEWLAVCDGLGFPVEVSLRFRLVPPWQAAADAGRKLAEASDQARHITQTSSELPLGLVEAVQRARQLEYAVAREGVPLVYGHPRFVLAAPTAQELAVRAGELVEAYRHLGITLVRPGGDQLALFCEAVPGDRVRVRAYEQRQALVTLAGGMFTATSELGDRRGPYIGETTGASRLPVLFDPLEAAQRNLPTAVAITGQPGAGKTHLAELLLYQLAIRGAWGLMIDPKNEAGGLAALPGLGAVRTLPVGPEHTGLLDPFRIAPDRWEGSLLAADVLRLLVPGDLGAAHEAALLEACRLEAEVAQPSLRGVAERLLAGAQQARVLGETLRAVGGLPLARLCFGSAASARLRPEDHLTILQMEGLSVPDAGTPTADYTLTDRLSVAVLYLVTALAGELADAAREHAKVIVIDEAWALTASRQGRALVQRLARTGRSKNTALVLVSQNARDFLGPEVQNNFSARFAFRSTQEQEVRDVCALLGIEPTPEHRALIRTLGNGECVFADTSGRVGAVQVDLVLRELAGAFDTTPHPSPVPSHRAATVPEPELVA